VPGRELRWRADIEHHDLTALQPGHQLLAAHDLDAVTLAQVGASQPVQPRDLFRRHVTHGHPQFGHPLAGQPVEDARSLPAGGHDACPGHRPQVMGGVRHALAEFTGDLLDRALTLGQQIRDLRPAAAGQRLRHLREGIKQCFLSNPVSHAFIIGPRVIFVKYSFDYLINGSSPVRPRCL